jgi:DNA helicase-2/ATP-dependent DNA helicase PcrA
MTKTTKEFDLAYKKLNIEQRLAVDTIEGPVMLVAGPGTGKTQTLALRIANILQKTDVLPSSILALTFTDAAATNMRLRLFSMIGETAYSVHISTFHSFCSDIIKDNTDIFHVPEHHDSLTELTKYKLIEDLLLSLHAHKLRPLNAPALYVPSIISSLSDLKREGVSPADFTALLDQEEIYLKENEGVLKKTEAKTRESNLAKNKELANIYVEYQNYLTSHNTYDFDDMINLVNSQFQSNPDFLASYQEIYHYFLIDEYQDTNTAQNKVVENLASHWGENANVFVVGDSNQSIMRFQGASLANALTFLKSYPRATHIKLIENYRSPQFVLDSAYSVIGHNPTAFQLAELRSNTKDTGAVQTVQCASGGDEVDYVTSQIKSLVDSGVDPSSVAVIYHNNIDGDALSHSLASSGIAYRLGHGGNLLDDFLIRQFLRMLYAIDSLRFKPADLDLFIVLNYPWFGLNTLDILKYSRTATVNKSTLFDVISSLPIGQKLMSYLSYDADHTLVDLVEHVLVDSGMLTHILSLTDSHIHLKRLSLLFDSVKDMNHAKHDLHLSEFLSDLTLMQTHGLKISDPSFAAGGSAVTLTTAHSSKGLEWDHVFIYKCIDGLWGNRKMPKLINLPESIVPEALTLKAEKDEDERRLFYVAMTRAKKTLTLTYAQEYQKNGKAKAVMHTMFVSELGTKIDKIEYASKHSELPSFAKQSPAVTQDESVYLNEIISEFRLSVTALNNYLKCGYYFKLQNLIKIPSAKEAYLSLGTAVHKALEWFYHELKDVGTIPPLLDLQHHFHLEIAKELLSSTDQELRSREGDQILAAYYNFHQGDLGTALFLEKFFGYGPSKILLNDIELTGAVDRIELMDENTKTVRVIDYKTGKPKSQKEIENSDNKRQLVFYKLLLGLDSTFKYEVGETQLDYVASPMLKGQSGKRSFKITDDEVEDLKNLIIDVMAKIRSLQFPRTTSLEECEKCPFIDHCYPNGLPID